MGMAEAIPFFHGCERKRGPVERIIAGFAGMASSGIIVPRLGTLGKAGIAGGIDLKGDFFHRVLPNGVEAYVYPAGKFKTFTVKVLLYNMLARETVTPTALIPMVLRRGCKGFETNTLIARHLDSLYGARFGAGVVKVGERQVIQIDLEIPNERFLQVDDDLLRRGMAFLKRILTEPVTETSEGKTSFTKAYVDQEKDVLAREIASIVNEKARYAMIRCIQEMCSSEPFGMHELGFPQDIPGIEGCGLYDLYSSLVRKAPIEVYIVGDVDEARAFDLVAQTFDFPREGTMELPPPRMVEAPDSPRVIMERQDVTQGKLCLGFRTGVACTDPEFYPMLFYDGVFGSFVHSKLFVNVREKAGLAYYASSYYNAPKGLLLVSSGIDSEKYSQALDIIQQQVEDMRNGRISDSEMDFTRKAIVNRLRSWEDSPSTKIMSFVELNSAGRTEGLKERLERVAGVTKDQVVEVARKVRLDTVYFLTGKEAR